MSLSRILFAVLVALCLLVGSLLFVPEPVNSRGLAHPIYTTMQIGGDGAARLATALPIGFLFGALQICFFVGLLALGLRRRGRLDDGGWALGLGLLVYLATFAALVRTYYVFAFDGVHTAALSFPTPSAWMLFGLWPVPLYFLVLYVARFDQWIFRHEDLETFREIVDARRRREAMSESEID